MTQGPQQTDITTREGFAAAAAPLERLLLSVPRALSETDILCSSVNVASTRAGIDMDAVRLCGEAIKDIAEATTDTDASGNVHFPHRLLSNILHYIRLRPPP